MMICPAEAALIRALEELRLGKNDGAKKYALMAGEAIQVKIDHPRDIEKEAVKEVVTKKKPKKNIWLWILLVIIIFGAWVSHEVKSSLKHDRETEQQTEN